MSAIRDTVRRCVRERILPEIGDWFERAYLPRELTKELAGLGLLRKGNRLSVQPVDAKHWEFILGLE